MPGGPSCRRARSPYKRPPGPRMKSADRPASRDSLGQAGMVGYCSDVALMRIMEQRVQAVGGPACVCSHCLPELQGSSPERSVLAFAQSWGHHRQCGGHVYSYQPLSIRAEAHVGDIWLKRITFTCSSTQPGDTPHLPRVALFQQCSQSSKVVKGHCNGASFRQCHPRTRVT
jgi:hypothetical protein